MDIAPYVATCTTGGVGPITLTAIAHVESTSRPYVVSSNGPRGMPRDERKKYQKAYDHSTPAAAKRTADALIAAGHSVDLGVMQINDANLRWLGMSTETVFHTCSALRGAAKLLKSNYDKAVKYGYTGQTALHMAIGAYNSGKLRADSEYVRKVIAAARALPPAGNTAPAPSPQGKYAPSPNNWHVRWGS